MTTISYAQNYEDVMLWRALQHVKAGFYVDVGANDPTVDSVTRWFYEQGWNGLNLEPVPYWHARLVKERPRDINLQIALSSNAGSAIFYDIPDTGLSTLDPAVAENHRQGGCAVRETEVALQTLDTVLQQHAGERDIHFLKIDVEGAEREVLLGANLVQKRPWIILVEATAPRSPETNHQHWEELLTGRGYQFAYFDGLNRFYVADEHAELLPALRTPPNTFDGFMRYAELQVRNDNHHLRQQIATLTGAHAGNAKGEIHVRLQEEIAQNKALRQRVDDMTHSTSWRITAPLRALRARRVPVTGPEAVSQLPLPAAAPVPEPQAPSSSIDQAALLLHQVTSHWRLVDQLLAQRQPALELTCALCGHQEATSGFKPIEAECRFGGGRLARHQCPACDVIFGPDKMLELTPQELSQEYDWHYRIFTEGDSTDQEIRAFFALDPQPGGRYLNYGAGAWSRSVQILREQGWDIVAYEPTQSVQSAQQQAGVITRPEELAEQRFDGIYSNNVLEHLRHPVQELRHMASLLKPGARMSHATPCYEYLYEYTRFHLFFYLGRSRRYLADQAGLDICSTTEDGHYMNTVYQPRAQ